jgi:hypothetical protein
MAQQTAVEYLENIINSLTHNGGSLTNDYIFLAKHIEQAKAIEKEQLYQVWLASEQWSDGEFLDSKKSFEEYYNETFKQQ